VRLLAQRILYARYIASNYRIGCRQLVWESQKQAWRRSSGVLYRGMSATKVPISESPAVDRIQPQLLDPLCYPGRATNDGTTVIVDALLEESPQPTVTVA